MNSWPSSDEPSSASKLPIERGTMSTNPSSGSLSSVTSWPVISSASGRVPKSKSWLPSELAWTPSSFMIWMSAMPRAPNTASEALKNTPPRNRSPEASVSVLSGAPSPPMSWARSALSTADMRGASCTALAGLSGSAKCSSSSVNAATATSVSCVIPVAAATPSVWFSPAPASGTTGVMAFMATALPANACPRARRPRVG